MCDYSLENVASRPAKVGDQLVTTAFNFITRGFSGIGDPEVAVCLLPGTEIAFAEDAEFDHPFSWLALPFGWHKIGERTARFRQINLTKPHTHRDGLEFANGKVVLVTQLCIGQRATVLQLPAQGERAAPQAQSIGTFAPAD